MQLPTVTVIVCTRDRADQLRSALTSVLELDYPAFDVVVVDNAGATDATRELIRTEFADPRVRAVSEPVPGLSRARNTGLLAATGEIVAYTDDDVIVDRHWLTGLVAGFARADDVSLVTGLVPSGELRTAVQRYFDDRVSWSGNIVARQFRLAEPPADLPAFPFSVGEFGTGANFALRRTVALEMGGFDTAFGVGSRTGGGEDLDIFTRVLFRGDALVVEPSALVWHRHRSDLDALRAQAVGYGSGLGAWLTKVALTPAMMKVAVRRAPDAVRRLAAKGGGSLETGSDSATGRLEAGGSGSCASRVGHRLGQGRVEGRLDRAAQRRQGPRPLPAAALGRHRAHPPGRPRSGPRPPLAVASRRTAPSARGNLSSVRASGCGWPGAARTLLLADVGTRRRGRLPCTEGSAQAGIQVRRPIRARFGVGSGAGPELPTSLSGRTPGGRRRRAGRAWRPTPSRARP